MLLKTCYTAYCLHKWEVLCNFVKLFAEKKFVEYLVVSIKVSTFATANEKQTPLTPRQALISEAKKRKSSLKDLHKQINVVQEPVMLNGMTGVKKRTVKSLFKT